MLLRLIGTSRGLSWAICLVLLLLLNCLFTLKSGTLFAAIKLQHCFVLLKWPHYVLLMYYFIWKAFKKCATLCVNACVAYAAHVYCLLICLSLSVCSVCILLNALLILYMLYEALSWFAQKSVLLLVWVMLNVLNCICLIQPKKCATLCVSPFVASTCLVIHFQTLSYALKRFKRI